MEVTPPSDERQQPEPDAEYEAAVAEWREWDRRATEAQSCEIAVAAQRSLERVRALEARRERRLRGEGDR